MLIIIIMAGAICGGTYMLRVSRYKRAVHEITYRDMDISGIADGTYTGECDVDIIRKAIEDALLKAE